MGSTRRTWRSGAALVGVAFAATACSTTQQVALHCITEEMQVYVDGRLLEGDRDSIELGVDAPHKLYVKRPDQAPRLVILVPEDTGDGIRLVPEDVCIELVPVGLDRELTVEVDETPGAVR